MWLRWWKLFLLSILFAIAAQPPTLAQSPDDIELQALYGRLVALHRAEQYAVGTRARYGENAPQHAVALAWIEGLGEEALRGQAEWLWLMHTRPFELPTSEKGAWLL
ncbi:MAG: hypothetical protein ACLPWS_13225 [Rhodomicrobium sp.]